MSAKIDNIKSKVQKLLNQAADRQGTPEGDVFQAKAFALMAQYGFQERDLADEEMVTIWRNEYVAEGSYLGEQLLLLNVIAECLHCTGYKTRSGGSRTYNSYVLFGEEHHADRVDMLFTMLNLQMLDLAMDDSNYTVISNRSTTSRRKAFMMGFIHGIRERLSQAEKNQAESVADTEAGANYALVLLEDANDAKLEMQDYIKEQGMRVGTSRKKSVTDSSAFYSGADAAKRTDIGQDRVHDRKALNA